MQGIRMWVWLLPAAWLVSGCTGPLEGRWRGLSEVNCGGGNQDRVSFTVDGDLHGDGEVCDCTFDFSAEDRGSDRYRLDMDFDSGCALLGDGKYDCDLQKGDTKLNCGDLGNYELQE